MKACIIGTGYVGLVVGTCFAELGHNVICVDNDEKKVAKLRRGIIPIYEPKLNSLIRANVRDKRLTFSSDLKSAVQISKVCFIAVGTPQGEDGSVNLKAVYQAAESIGKAINCYKIIVNKSTVPVGTAEKIAKIINGYTDERFDVVSNPEFLRQGAAVDDFLKPDRIIIGSDSTNATMAMQELYEPLIKTGTPVIIMDVKSAEMTKYAANAFLAIKISYSNEIANICAAVGANTEMVRIGVCADKRIGSQSMFAGLGYGGSCFPKDVKQLIQTAIDNNCDYSLLESANKINKMQRYIFVKQITDRFGKDLNCISFAVWGLAFKPNTNDMREAPAIEIIRTLLNYGAKIKAYDPKAMETARQYFGNTIDYASSAYNALKNADAMLLLTEWNEFKDPNFNRVKALLKSPIIFDGRNQYNCSRLMEKGFEYYNIEKRIAKLTQESN